MNKNSESPIQLFVPTYRTEEILGEIRGCLELGWTGLGYKTVEFEDRWKTYTGLPNAHFLNSATVGLQLALKMLKIDNNWKDNDEIISTPLTFVSTNHVILQENLKPVFADVDNYACMDPKSLEERITKKTKAVIFVGLGGNVGRLKEVELICKKYNLKLILDAAHMAGTRWKNGQHVGNEADVTVFSFQAVKNLPTADSGMICFKDENLDSEVRKWSWLGINKDTFSRTHSQGAYKWMYDVEHVGYKAHGNSIMAAMGLVSLKYLDQDNSYRRQIASWYDEKLKSHNDIRLIPTNPSCDSSRHLYQILVNDRDNVMLALNNANIFPGVHYRDNSNYRMYQKNKPCKNAVKYSQELITLPIHMRLTHSDIIRVCDTLIQSLDKQKGSKYSKSVATRVELEIGIEEAKHAVSELSKSSPNKQKNSTKKTNYHKEDRKINL